MGMKQNILFMDIITQVWPAEIFDFLPADDKKNFNPFPLLAIQLISLGQWDPLTF